MAYCGKNSTTSSHHIEILLCFFLKKISKEKVDRDVKKIKQGTKNKLPQNYSKAGEKLWLCM